MTLERQEALGLVVPESVAVIGCGGVGSWAAMFLALAGVPRLALWDMDMVSETNLNRLPLGPEYLNQAKSLALAHSLHRLVPECDITAMFKWTLADAQRGAERQTDSNPKWVVCSTDTWASRREVWEWARKNAVKYIEASAEGEWGGVTGEPATFATPDEENPGYASIPVHVGPCVVAASLACYYVLHAKELGVASWRVGWTKTGVKVQAFKPKPTKVDGGARPRARS
jgi:hypothetical protein